MATPTGPIPIECLRVGDIVFGFENGQVIPTVVEKIWDNGIQEVLPMGSKYKTYLAGTSNHKLWACHERQHDEVDYVRKELCKLDKRQRIRRVYLDSLIQGGTIHQDGTYSLGCMMGNGCCRNGKTIAGTRSKHLYISAPNCRVPAKMAKELGCAFERTHESSYTWKLVNAYGKLPYFHEWLCMRYSHEKIADWDVINTWDRASCLAFLAGVIDTDGCVRYKDTNKAQVIIQIGMQARSVIECCQKIIHKYFQEKVIIGIDVRDKYKNGPCYTLNITSNLLAMRIMEAIHPYAVKRIDMSSIKLHNILPDRITLLQQDDPYLAHTYDITVANSTNLYVLHDGGIITSNSGKSEIAKRKLVLEAINPDSGYADPNYFAAAPTRDQAQRIYWKDLKALIPKELITNIMESKLVIELYNGASIYVVGMDKPERLEGIPWNGGILDEYGNMKPKAWVENVRPALSDRKGWCWLIGVPEGRNHYYDLYLQAMEDKSGDWAVFQWPSSDILDASEIDSAKRMLDDLTFQQEYMADFVSFSGRAYYNFDIAKHVSKALSYNPHAPLAFCFDFNVSPGVAVIVQEQILPGCFEQIPNPHYFSGQDAFRQAAESKLEDAFIRRPVTGTGVIGEVHIAQNSTTPAVCRKLIQDWGDHEGEIFCYGDASGGAKGSSQTQGSDWDLIHQVLSGHFGDRVSLFVPRANPSERSRVNAMNTRLKAADGTIRMLIDANCEYLIRDFEGVRVLEGGAGEIDKKRDPKLTHLSDGLGYFVVYEYPVQAEQELLEFPIANRF